MKEMTIYRMEHYENKDRSDFVFKEMSEGIYSIEKSPNIKGLQKFVGSETVLSYLNSSYLVYVINKRQHYSNFK